MAADIDQGQRHGFTRRSFLGMTALGLAAVAGAGAMLRHLLPSSDKKEGNDLAAQFPGPDSMFHPREDVLKRKRGT
jgi:hypothetical protein